MSVNPDAETFGDSGRILLSQRFSQIMGAKPASAPYASGAAAMRTEEQKLARREKLKALREKKMNKPVAQAQKNEDVEMADAEPAQAAGEMPDHIKSRLYQKDE